MKRPEKIGEKLVSCNWQELAQTVLKNERYVDHLEKQLEQTNSSNDIQNVSKSIAKQYAEFCVRCDREGLPLLELDDYIKQYCC